MSLLTVLLSIFALAKQHWCSQCFVLGATSIQKQAKSESALGFFQDINTLTVMLCIKEMVSCWCPEPCSCLCCSSGGKHDVCWLCHGPCPVWPALFPARLSGNWPGFLRCQLHQSGQCLGPSVSCCVPALGVLPGGSEWQGVLCLQLQPQPWAVKTDTTKGRRVCEFKWSC